MNRRGVMVGGVAVVAGAAGLGVALWRAGQRGDAVADTVWSQEFDRPGGGRLRLDSLRGAPLLLNFWATWCPPCVSEMPMLDTFQRAHPEWKVAGLAVDNAAPVDEFLRRHPVAYPVGLAGANGVELSRQLGNQGGGLPFSVLFDRKGELVERKLGVIVEGDLQAWTRRFG